MRTAKLVECKEAESSLENLVKKTAAPEGHGAGTGTRPSGKEGGEDRRPWRPESSFSGNSVRKVMHIWIKMRSKKHTYLAKEKSKKVRVAHQKGKREAPKH